MLTVEPVFLPLENNTWQTGPVYLSEMFQALSNIRQSIKTPLMFLHSCWRYSGLAFLSQTRARNNDRGHISSTRIRSWKKKKSLLKTNFTDKSCRESLTDQRAEAFYHSSNAQCSTCPSLSLSYSTSLKGHPETARISSEPHEASPSTQWLLHIY